MRFRCASGAPPVRLRCASGAPPVRLRCASGAPPVRLRCLLLASLTSSPYAPVAGFAPRDSCSRPLSWWWTHLSHNLPPCAYQPMAVVMRAFRLCCCGGNTERLRR